MRIKLKYPDVETFIQKYAVNISRGGIFIATKQPKPVGTFVQVRVPAVGRDHDVDHSRRGAGAVDQGVRRGARRCKAHGMGVKFSRLDADSQAVIDRALRWRADHGTNPGAPMPIPTSSAHTIATRNESQADRLPERDEPRAEPMREPPIETFASPGEETTTPSLEPPVRSVDTNEPLPPMPPTRGETRPIAIDHIDDDMHGRPANVETRPIPISMRAASRTRPARRDRRARQRVGIVRGEAGEDPQALARARRRRGDGRARAPVVEAAEAADADEGGGAAAADGALVEEERQERHALESAQAQELDHAIDVAADALLLGRDLVGDGAAARRRCARAAPGAAASSLAPSAPRPARAIDNELATELAHRPPVRAAVQALLRRRAIDAQPLVVATSRRRAPRRRARASAS